MQSYPFTSQVTYDEQGLPLYDRAVDSGFLREVLDGVFYTPASALQVTSGAGMQVQVQPGACHIQGAMGIEKSQRTLSLPAAGSQPRIDTVVARLDLSIAVRSVELYVIAGMPAANPQPPALTRDGSVWELGLADVLVAANAGSISQSAITDTRLDPVRCGAVAQTIDALDTAPYFAQLQQAIEEHRAAAEAQIAALEQEIAGIEAGSAVMLPSVYDPNGHKADCFAASNIDYAPADGGDTTVEGALDGLGEWKAAVTAGSQAVGRAASADRAASAGSADSAADAAKVGGYAASTLLRVSGFNSGSGTLYTVSG